MAIDWISNNWYLVDGGREALYVCEVSLHHCRLLVDSALAKVHGLALDPAAGLVCFCFLLCNSVLLNSVTPLKLRSR